MADIFDLFKQIAKKDNVPQTPPTHIIAGLGNPGAEYANTRHNAGFMAIEALAQQLGVRVERAKFKSLTATATVGDQKILLMMPQTYMNNSGEAVREAMQFYKIPPERCLILFDDISLDVGAVRVRRKGSDGGQKGMKSIIFLTGSDQFPRIRLGIGAKPHPDADLAAHVLSHFSQADAKLMVQAAEKAAKAAQVLVTEGVDQASNRFSS